jgi:predicted lipoprotein with Yx(FWY)xxD motif
VDAARTAGIPTTSEVTMKIRALGTMIAGSALLAACGGYGGSSSAAPARHPDAHAKAATAPSVAVRSTSLGDVLVDAQGHTLYGFADDTQGTSTCTGSCAAIWPALTAGSGLTVGARLDRTTFHTSANGSQQQVVAGRWPLYRYAGDRQPGDVNGQGLEHFFAVRPDGTLLMQAGVSTGTPMTAARSTAGTGW